MHIALALQPSPKFLFFGKGRASVIDRGKFALLSWQGFRIEAVLALTLLSQIDSDMMMMTVAAAAFASSHIP